MGGKRASERHRGASLPSATCGPHTHADTLLEDPERWWADVLVNATTPHS